MLALIFANGELDSTEQFQHLLNQAGLIIAADGGANHCSKLGITPDVLLGDFDSINLEVLKQFKDAGVSCYSHPARKDATDLELALDLALEKGADTIWLLGALGKRWDMSLANILLAGCAKYKSQRLSLLAQDSELHILHSGVVHQINGSPGNRISFLPLQGDIHGITLAGFEYPLNNHTINFGSSLGVSNVLALEQATVQFSKGVLLCVKLTDG